MALVTAADFKTQAAAMAAALTTAWSDTVGTFVAAEIAHNHHPLRNIKKLFNFNPATGVVTSNDDYIDAAYAGNYPNKGTDFGVDTKLAVALATGVVEDAEPADIVLTFNQAITSVQGLSVGGTVTTPKAISSISIVGAVVTIVVDSAYIATDVITLSGSFTSVNGTQIGLIDQSITNNVL